MSFLMRLLAATPRTMTLPVIAILAGWYGGAKYGAPDWALNSIDDLLSRSGAAIGSFLGGDEDAPADENDDGADV